MIASQARRAARRGYLSHLQKLQLPVEHRCLTHSAGATSELQHQSTKHHQHQHQQRGYCQAQAAARGPDLALDRVDASTLMYMRHLASSPEAADKENKEDDGVEDGEGAGGGGGGDGGESGDGDGSSGSSSSSEGHVDHLVPLEDMPIAYGGPALKPREVVEKLDKYIVGQDDAKRAVAIALRNRWRRHQLQDELKQEVIPKNILMIGPTGCGKTEIARRIAKLSQAPFIKVEATKFTEVGFHGRDVDQIIRDLVEISITMTKKVQSEKLRGKAQAIVKEQLIDKLTGEHSRKETRDEFTRLLQEGLLEDREVEVDVPTGGFDKAPSTVSIMDGNAAQGLNDFFSKMQKGMGGKRPTEKKTMHIKEASPILEEIALEKLLESVDITKDAIQAVEQSGIVCIDELDKICNTGDYRGADASAEGVQRDMLPLIEGSSISTKHGNVNTDFILFIGSGAFHQCKPSDLLAELQGRLPIRVELQALSEEDLYRILTEPVTNLIRQQVEMLQAEGVVLTFTDGAVLEMARVAAVVNKTVENIGARRLHTVIERIMEPISFEAPDKEAGTEIVVDLELVQERVSDLLVKSDLSKYIL